MREIDGMKKTKKNSTFKIRSLKGILACFVCALVFWLSGCGYVAKVDSFLDEVAMDVLMLGSDGELAQLGETEAEGRRRHLRNLRINRQEMIQDIDRVLLFDKPSKLTDKRIP